MSRRVSLRGKTVVITGGSRGLGLEMARVFAQRGSKIALCGRDAVAVERAVSHLRARGAEVFGQACDLGDARAASAFVRATHDRFGAIDVVVNNAGVIDVGPLSAITVEKFEEVMRSNFWSAVHVTFAALPLMREDGRAKRVVNISSIGGRVALPHMLSYTASKFALTGFSEGLSCELDAFSDAPRVLTVVPGLMRTGSYYNAEFSGRRSAEFGWFSVGASLPLLTIDARIAAERIVRATEDGRRQLSFGLAGVTLELLRRLSPRFTSLVMGVTARILPASDRSAAALEGRLVDSKLPGSWALRMGDRAARRNNEMPPRRARA